MLQNKVILIIGIAFFSVVLVGCNRQSTPVPQPVVNQGTTTVGNEGVTVAPTIEVAPVDEDGQSENEEATPTLSKERMRELENQDY